MIESLGDLNRTGYCGELTQSDIGREVVLTGWVQRRRDHGGLVFIDLRDRTGLIQVVFNPQEDPETHERSHAVRSEYVLAVKGLVRARPEDMINPKLNTGLIEVFIHHLRVLNTANTPPFQIEDDLDVSEAIRLKYRYLDLRRPKIMQNLIMRHNASRITRNFPQQRRVHRGGDAGPDAVHAGRRPGLPGPVQGQPGPVLRPAPVPAAVQTAPDGVRIRPVLSDRPLLPGRGPAGRPAAGVHSDRSGDVLYPGRRPDRTDGKTHGRVVPGDNRPRGLPAVSPACRTRKPSTASAWIDRTCASDWNWSM